MEKKTLNIGTRGSALARIQTQDALDRIAALFPMLAFNVVPVTTVGDRDLQTDLRASPGDFFTRELDDAVREGRADFAVHSAKDLPAPMPDGLDWFWLPWREDPRDAWILPVGKTMVDLPSAPRVGISSDRREAYCRGRFPDAETKPIRGTIPDRLAQLDAGDFDAVLMAGAALNRLGLTDRVTEWIPLADLPVPAGQGHLAITFKYGNPLLTKLRAYFVKAVRFVGAGVGSADYCTLGGASDLRHADVCLYDILMDDALLAFLPDTAERVFVGKRCGEHSMTQPEITTLIANYARQGKRVVRLKGGDPGLFGRLAEEIEELERLDLPYRVRAGVSALTVATTGTGMLLTRRGVSRGFTVMTPRMAHGVGTTIGAGSARLEGATSVLFMSVAVASQMARQLLNEGESVETPAAIVFNAGADDEEVVRMTLGALANSDFERNDAPGLILVGPAAATVYRRDAGALGGTRVLLTCSEALMEKAALRVTDFGGIPLLRPMIRLVPCRAKTDFNLYDWIALTSPSAAQIFMEGLLKDGDDLRRLPKIMTCGPGSAAVIRRFGLTPDLAPPMDYSAAGLADMLRGMDFNGQRVLRLRSEKAGSLLADVLCQGGGIVDDVTLYENVNVRYTSLPPFDSVFFASASAVESFAVQFGAAALDGRTIVAIGKPTETALRAIGHTPHVTPPSATVGSAIEALARKTLL